MAVAATLVGPSVAVGSSAWPAAISVSARNACASEVSGRSAGRSSASGRDGAYCAKKREPRASSLRPGDRSTPIMMRLSQSPTSKPCVMPVARE